MSRLFFIAFLVFLSALTGFPQQTITLTFTAIDSASCVQLDSIKVMNRTQDCDTVLHWNDTILVLNVPVGVPDIKNRKEEFRIRSYPNPVTDHATLELALPEPGKTVLTVIDVLGRSLFALDRDLQAGTHTFNFIPGNERMYILTASWNDYRKSIKMVNSSQCKGQQCSISYQGYDDVVSSEKASEAMQGFTFGLGDELLYIGYKDTLESGLLDSPDTSQTYTLQFAYNIPCPGTPIVNYEERVYTTVQIFSQCWLKENLNLGTMIHGTIEMTNNGIIEKYCYYNDTNNCNQYGGLYQWDEMMQYSTQQGIKGICPPGWHLPADEEWKVLEGAVDSQHSIGDQIWNLYGLRGYDAGTNLKSTNGWSGNGNGSGLYGFTGLPGGYRYSNGYFYLYSQHGLWWSSTEGNSTSAWNRYLSYNNPIVDRDYGDNKGFGFSVRCIKD